MRELGDWAALRAHEEAEGGDVAAMAHALHSNCAAGTVGVQCVQYTRAAGAVGDVCKPKAPSSACLPEAARRAATQNIYAEVTVGRCHARLAAQLARAAGARAPCVFEFAAPGRGDGCIRAVVGWYSARGKTVTAAQVEAAVAGIIAGGRAPRALQPAPPWLLQYEREIAQTRDTVLQAFPAAVVATRRQCSSRRPERVSAAAFHRVLQALEDAALQVLRCECAKASWSADVLLPGAALVRPLREDSATLSDLCLAVEGAIGGRLGLCLPVQYSCPTGVPNVVPAVASARSVPLPTPTTPAPSRVSRSRAGRRGRRRHRSCAREGSDGGAHAQAQPQGGGTPGPAADPLPLASGAVDFETGWAALQAAGWDADSLLRIPVATAPHVPRSLVLPLAAAVQELAQEVTAATARGPTDAARAWYAFLLFPCLVLHCTPGRVPVPGDEESLCRLLHARLHQFRRGNWDGLARQAADDTPSSAGPSVPAGEDDPRRWERCCTWVAVGEWRRGLQTLLSAGVARGSPATLLATLRGLFRRETRPSVSQLGPPPGVPPLQLNERVFTRALRTGGRRTAPGPTGWRYEHLRVLLQLPGGVRPLLGVAQLLVDGNVPQPIVAHLGGAALTPLAKPGNGVRPLAVGETVRRLTARAVCSQCRDEFAEDLAPHQFAVGMPGGCEVVYKCVLAAAEMHPESLVVAVDLRNAYNRILRGSCVEGLESCRPALGPFVRLFYQRASCYQYRDGGGQVHDVTADEGVEQGDALAPVLFSYGIRRALGRAQRRCDALARERRCGLVRIFAYLDDIVLVADPSIAESCLTALQEELGDCGLALAEDKTQAWAPSGQCPPGGLAEVWAREGMVILGGPAAAAGAGPRALGEAPDEGARRAFPLGAADGRFVRAFWEGRLAHMRTAAAALRDLALEAPVGRPALLVALQLLAVCVAPRADHLLRHLPPSDGCDLGEHVDRLLAETLSRLFAFQLSEEQWQQAQFELVGGGVGLRRRGGPYAAAAHLASWAQCYHQVVQATGFSFCGDLAAAPPGSLAQGVFAAANAVAACGEVSAAPWAEAPTWEAVALRPFPRLQRLLCRGLRAGDRAAWLRRAGPEACARLHTSSGWGAGAALMARPTEALLQLPDEDVRIAVCERLGVPRCPEGVCARRFLSGRVCGKALRGGWHAHCCPGLQGCLTQGRHNPLVRELARYLSAAGRFVRVEQRDPTMGPTARLDVVEFASEYGGPAAYDVSVVTAFREDPAFVQECGNTPGWAASERHAEKLRQQYADRLPGARLIPVVAEAGGRWHSSVPKLLRGLARAYVGREVGLPGEAAGVVVARWAARLSALLIRGNGLAVRAAAPARPEARVGRGVGGGLPAVVPEGDSAYELLVR